LRVVKFRGSAHGTNEYPFMLGENGVSVLPITSLRLEHVASKERMSTGIAQLDEMLGGRGVYRGTSVHVTGPPGAGKSSIGAAFANAACARGERAMLFVYEESASQLLRNMASIGIDLQPWIDQGLLQVQASRPTFHGLEQHLTLLHMAVGAFKPAVVVVDPISNLSFDSDDTMLKATLMRLIDYLKDEEVTAVFTNLTADTTTALASTPIGVSSLMDTWIMLSNQESNGERTRTIQVLKSRGMSHSNKVREFILSDHGIAMIDVVVKDGRILTGRYREAHAALQPEKDQGTTP
jgi:circadian clock protein KaiC